MRTGILLEEQPDGGFDLLLDVEGKMKRGSTAQQEAHLCVLSNKGEWRQFPTAGFGIEMRLRKRVGGAPFVENVPKFRRDLRIELEADRHQEIDITVTENLDEFTIKILP